MSYESDETELGGRFWLVVLGFAVGGVIAAAIFLLLFGMAWYTWGFFGALLVFGAALIGFGYIYDRRHENRRELME